MTNLTTSGSGRRFVAAALLAAVTCTLVACGDGASDKAASETSAAPARTASTPAALPSQDWSRLACEALPTGWLELLDNLADTRRAAENALKSSDPVMQRHGMDLRDAVNTREAADLGGDQGAAVDANLDISRAALDMAEACSTLYGDGNW